MNSPKTTAQLGPILATIEAPMSPPRILLQTTIPPTEDDWSIARFGLLTEYLAGLRDAVGQPLSR